MVSWCLSIFSILYSDCASLPRRDWFYRQRIGIALVTALGITLSMSIWSGSGLSPGLLLYKHLSVGLVILAFLVALAEGTQQLARERRQQTLDLLLLSEVSPLQLLIAKTLSAMVHSLLSLLAALPLFAVAAGLGGISWSLGVALPWLLVIVVFIGVAMGLSVSAAIPDISRARVYTSVLGLVVYLLIPASLSILLNAVSQLPEHILMVVSPVAAMVGMFSDHSLSILSLHALVMVLVGVCCLILASWRLPRSLQVPHRPPLLRQFTDELRSTQTVRRFMARPAIQGNPIAWQDLHLIHGGKRTSWLKLIFGSTLIIIVVLGLSAMAQLPQAEAWGKAWLFLCLFHGIVLIAGMITACLTSFQRDRRNGALELLLSSDLRIEELLLGKLTGVVLGYSPYGICLFISFAAALVFVMTPTDQLVLFLIVIEILGVLFACCSVALYQTIRTPHRIRLAPVFIMYSVLWVTIAYLFPKQNGVQAHALFTLISTIWHIYVGTLCWRIMLRHGREILLHSLSPEQPISQPATG